MCLGLFMHSGFSSFFLQKNFLLGWVVGIKKKLLLSLIVWRVSCALCGFSWQLSLTNSSCCSISLWHQWCPSSILLLLHSFGRVFCTAVGYRVSVPVLQQQHTGGSSKLPVPAGCSLKLKNFTWNTNNLPMQNSLCFLTCIKSFQHKKNQNT